MSGVPVYLKTGSYSVAQENCANGSPASASRFKRSRSAGLVLAASRRVSICAPALSAGLLQLPAGMGPDSSPPNSQAATSTPTVCGQMYQAQR
jgi:hypothetical protein